MSFETSSSTLKRSSYSSKAVWSNTEMNRPTSDLSVFAHLSRISLVCVVAAANTRAGDDDDAFTGFAMLLNAGYSGNRI